MNPLLQLLDYGQSFWLDNLARPMIEGGDLKRRIAQQGLRGVTSNPKIFKDAIAGGDANWGRIVMAVGKAGEKADRDRLSIAIGGVPITKDGQVRPDYDEAPVARHIAGREVTIAIDVGVGRGRARVWTCDLTHGYIDINGAYRS